LVEEGTEEGIVNPRAGKQPDDLDDTSTTAFVVPLLTAGDPWTVALHNRPKRMQDDDRRE